jgi:molecular chaperone DnaJ
MENTKGSKKREWFEILGVPENAKEEDIKKAYHKLAVEYHPDKNKGKEERAEIMFKKVNEAYENLQSRSTTLSMLKNCFRSQDLQSSFEHFFVMNEGSMGSLKFAASQENLTRLVKKNPKRGQSLQTLIQLDFFESIRGCRKIIEFQRNVNCHCNPQDRKDCANCKGTARIEVKRTTVVEVAPGTSSETSKTLIGEGDEGEDGGASGDLIVQFKVTPHPYFERLGSDVHCKVSLPFPLAVLGTKIEVPCLYGEPIVVTVPPGTQHDDVIVVVDQGFLATDSEKKRGEMHLRICILVPKTLTEDEKQLLKILASKPAFKPLFLATPLDTPVPPTQLVVPENSQS